MFMETFEQTINLYTAHMYVSLPTMLGTIKGGPASSRIWPYHFQTACYSPAESIGKNKHHTEKVLPAVKMRLPHSLDENDHGDGIGRDTMVRAV